MTTLTANIATRTSGKETSFSLFGLIAALFAVNLRETLDAVTRGDKSDAAYAWGL